MEQHTPGSRLYDLTAFLEQQSSLDECLTELAVMSARVLNTQNCSIMLIKKDSGEIALRVFAHSGYLPDRAHQEAVKIKQGVSGYVASTGKSLLVENIDKSDFAPLKRGRYKSRGFIAAPIKLHDTVVGVINANTPIGRRNIDRRDLELLIVIALLIGKTIEVNQLQNLLQSQYVQHALAKEHHTRKTHIPVSAEQSPEKIAKILAKTFYAEMSRAGFGPDHMLTTATEIVSLLSHKVKLHKERLKKTDS